MPVRARRRASNRWLGGSARRRDSLPHLPNIPTEEVFTTPDPERTEGHVTSTRPLDVGGTIQDLAAGGS